jgi:hypothetical protein
MKVAIMTFGGKGRGVGATERIARGEIIEICPVLVLPADEPVQPSLADYVYCWKGRNVADGWDGWEGSYCLALGFGSMYNHSYNPNARFDFLLDTDQMSYVDLRDIVAGEEVTVNYNGHNPRQDYPVWFEEKN